MRRDLVLLAGMLAFGAGLAAAGEFGEQEIRTWLSGFDAAFGAKDLSRLAAFYHPDVTIYEGGRRERARRW